MTNKTPHNHTPHDTLFKDFFSHKEIVADFLRKAIPKDVLDTIDITSLALKPADFVASRYRGRRSGDMLWYTQTYEGNEIDFLLQFEAESTDQHMVPRILEYQAAIIKQFLNTNPGKKIPTILSFVLYHGKRPWQTPKSIAEAFQDFATQVNYGYTTPFVIALAEETAKDIEAYGQASICLRPLWAYANNKVKEERPGVLAAAAQKKDPVLQEYTLKYYLSVCQGDEERIFDEISTFDASTKLKFKNMFELARKKAFEQGIEKGVQQCMLENKDTWVEKGKIEGKIEAIQAMQEAGMITPEQAQAMLKPLH